MLERAGDDAARPEWLEPEFGVRDGLYYLTEQQAQAILDLRLQKLTGLEHEKLLDEYKELLDQIAELLRILGSADRLMEVIREELELVREQFGDKRRTEITANSADINLEDLITQEDVVVTLSHQGYVKYQPLSEYEAQRRGGKGKSAARIKEEDFIDRTAGGEHSRPYSVLLQPWSRLFDEGLPVARSYSWRAWSSDRQPAAAGTGRTYHRDPAGDRV